MLVTRIAYADVGWRFTILVIRLRARPGAPATGSAGTGSPSGRPSEPLAGNRYRRRQAIRRREADEQAVRTSLTGSRPGEVEDGHPDRPWIDQEGQPCRRIAWATYRLSNGIDSDTSIVPVDASNVVAWCPNSTPTTWWTHME